MKSKKKMKVKLKF